MFKHLNIFLVSPIYRCLYCNSTSYLVHVIYTAVHNYRITDTYNTVLSLLFMHVIDLYLVIYIAMQSIYIIDNV